MRVGNTDNTPEREIVIKSGKAQICQLFRYDQLILLESTLFVSHRSRVAVLITDDFISN